MYTLSHPVASHRWIFRFLVVPLLLASPTAPLLPPELPAFPQRSGGGLGDSEKSVRSDLSLSGLVL